MANEPATPRWPAPQLRRAAAPRSRRENAMQSPPSKVLIAIIMISRVRMSRTWLGMLLRATGEGECGE